MTVLVALPPVIFGVLLVLLSWLAGTGRLGPNHLAGIRTPATLASPEAWRAAHRAAAPWWAGTAVAAIALGVVGGLNAPSALGMILVGAALIVVFVGVVVGSVPAVIAARRVGRAAGR